ncbi:DUF3397 domain-containing protein [Kurthia gibsonii]|uniref:DUF3397 domain-containing protein n=1 Tax=Kurthia gibsonii TaxID=33946 RepID=UPI0031B6F3EE
MCNQVSVLFNVLHLIVLYPFLLFFFLFFLLKRFKRTKGNAMHRAMDVTTCILLFSIQALCQTLYGYDLGVLIQILVTLTFMVIVLRKWYKNPEVQVAKIFKKFWRILFLVLSSIYLTMLLVYAILKSVELF